MEISEKQKRFVDEYLIDLNATQAAIRAGYSEKTANEQASRLLTNVNIQNYLSERRKAIQQRTEITQDRIMREYAKLGFADIRKAVKWSPTLGNVDIDGNIVSTNGVQLVDSGDLDDDTAAAVAEIGQTAQGIKIKMHDKKGALDSMSRILGLFNDKVNVGGQPGNPLQISGIEFRVVDPKD